MTLSVETHETERADGSRPLTYQLTVRDGPMSFRVTSSDRSEMLARVAAVLDGHARRAGAGS